MPGARTWRATAGLSVALGGAYFFPKPVIFEYENKWAWFWLHPTPSIAEIESALHMGQQKIKSIGLPNSSDWALLPRSSSSKERWLQFDGSKFEGQRGRVYQVYSQVCPEIRDEWITAALKCSATTYEQNPKLPLKNFESLDISRVEGKVEYLVGMTNEIMYLAVPGSRGRADWMTNFSIMNLVGAFHYGFESETVTLLHLATKLLDLNESKTLVLCGHSKGGAIAHLLHHKLTNRGDKNRIYSIAFGAPSWVDHNAAINSDSFLTVINKFDPVPCLLDPTRIQEAGYRFGSLVDWLVSPKSTVSTVLTSAVDLMLRVIPSYAPAGSYLVLDPGKKTAEFYLAGSFSNQILNDFRSKDLPVFGTQSHLHRIDSYSIYLNHVIPLLESGDGVGAPSRLGPTLKHADCKWSQNYLHIANFGKNVGYAHAIEVQYKSGKIVSFDLTRDDSTLSAVQLLVGLPLAPQKTEKIDEIRIVSHFGKSAIEASFLPDVPIPSGDLATSRIWPIAQGILNAECELPVMCGITPTSFDAKVLNMTTLESQAGGVLANLLPELKDLQNDHTWSNLAKAGVLSLGAAYFASIGWAIAVPIAGVKVLHNLYRVYSDPLDVPVDADPGTKLRCARQNEEWQAVLGLDALANLLNLRAQEDSCLDSGYIAQTRLAEFYNTKLRVVDPVKWPQIIRGVCRSPNLCETSVKSVITMLKKVSLLQNLCLESKAKPAILVVGPKHSGKTSFLSNAYGESATHISALGTKGSTYVSYFRTNNGLLLIDTPGDGDKAMDEATKAQLQWIYSRGLVPRVIVVMDQSQMYTDGAEKFVSNILVSLKDTVGNMPVSSKIMIIANQCDRAYPALETETVEIVRETFARGLGVPPDCIVLAACANKSSRHRAVSDDQLRKIGVKTASDLPKYIAEWTSAKA